MSSDLSFFIPHHGRAKISLCIPESFNLYLCPQACVRRVSIRALRNNTREAMGFLFMTEVDVATGLYEDCVADAVADILHSLESKPRAFFIHLNCIDDFLGTDENALLDALRTRFPEAGFAVVRMNPIAADRGFSTGLRIHDRLYSMLEPALHTDDAVNLVGNFASLDADCELYEVLRAWGINEVRQLFVCKNYDAYQDLAASRLNLALAHIGTYAAENMETRLGIPHVYIPVDYSLEGVRRQYRMIGEVLGCIDTALPTLEAASAEAQLAVARACEALGDTPVIVDSSAAMRPFALAKTLIEYGFNICAVFALHEKDDDAPNRDWLAQNAPGVAVVYSESYEGIRRLGLPDNAVCIGFDSAYLLKACRFVNIQKDEGLFGFQAVRRLMDLMVASLSDKTTWE